MITDRHNRIHDYLRIAITDNCNFRCAYCMPDEKIQCMPTNKLMSVDEIFSIAETFVKLGVNKIRLTGGEPLLRKDFSNIIHRLSILPVQLALTTNGLLLHHYIDDLKRAGINSINVSLDTLKPELFLTLTKRNHFERVWSNIKLLLASNIYVKLNMVVMKGVNDDEIPDFVELTKNHNLHVRFIEFMPFNGNRWNKDKVIIADQILERIAEHTSFIKMVDNKHDTSRKYKPLNYTGTFAIISTMSHPFCGDCNRIRLTADGKLKNCLFSVTESDLLGALRKGDQIEEQIYRCLASKHKERGGQIYGINMLTNADTIINISMDRIGG